MAEVLVYLFTVEFKLLEHVFSVCCFPLRHRPSRMVGQFDLNDVKITKFYSQIRKYQIFFQSHFHLYLHITYSALFPTKILTHTILLISLGYTEVRIPFQVTEKFLRPCKQINYKVTSPCISLVTVSSPSRIG